MDPHPQEDTKLIHAIPCSEISETFMDEVQWLQGKRKQTLPPGPARLAPPLHSRLLS